MLTSVPIAPDQHLAHSGRSRTGRKRGWKQGRMSLPVGHLPHPRLHAGYLTSFSITALRWGQCYFTCFSGEEPSAPQRHVTNKGQSLNSKPGLYHCIFLATCNSRAPHTEYLEARFTSDKSPNTEIQDISQEYLPGGSVGEKQSPWDPQGRTWQVTPIRWALLFTSKSLSDWKAPGIHKC